MKKYLIVASLLFSSGMHAGWLTDWSHWISFNIFNTKQQSRLDCGATLRAVANEFQRCREQENAFITLLYAMNDAGVGDFFSNGGICRIPEVSSLLNIIRAEQAARKALAEANLMNEDQQDAHYNMTKNLADEMRELPHLGPLVADNPILSHYFLSFKGKLLLNGRLALRIALVERIVGTKEMQNRKTGLKEAVPRVKNKVKHMFFGVEKDNGTFDWQKTIHTSNVPVAKEQGVEHHTQVAADRERKYEAGGNGTGLGYVDRPLAGASKKSKQREVHFKQGCVSDIWVFKEDGNDTKAKDGDTRFFHGTCLTDISRDKRMKLLFPDKRKRFD